ncbi:MAG: ParB/RepB/Spo0J family partition protein [Bacilli bacterium]|nr:ParB/RepB/Spo0J family partition protein [Bacilli bacterium]
MENANEEVVQLYLDDIIPNRFQPREVFDDQALKELAVSIREHGVIQPILVRKFGEKYEIIAGERRYKASTMAGLTKIPAIIKNLDDKEASKVALIENLQRRDLTPVEEARTYQKILDLDQMTQEQLAKTMGKSQSAVSNKLRLLTLPDEVQEALLNNKISERHARSLLNAPKNAQVSLLKEVIDNKMTVRELDSRIKAMTGDNGTDSATGGATPASVQDNNFLFNNGGNVMNNYDPTAVDINKIREQSVDINSMNTNPVPSEPKNIDSLLLGGATPTVTPPQNENRFIPDNMDTTIEKTEDGNEVIGNGLLAGMPVIKETPNNSNSIFTPPVVDTIQPEPMVDNNMNNQTMSTPQPEPAPTSLFATPPTPVEQPSMMDNANNVVPPVQPEPVQPVPQEQPQPEPTSNSLFTTPPTPIEQPPMMDNANNMVPPAQPEPVQPAPVDSEPTTDVNSLFSTPAPEQVPINTGVVPTQPMSAAPSGPNKYSINFDFSQMELNPKKIEEMKQAKAQEQAQQQAAQPQQPAPVAPNPILGQQPIENNQVNIPIPPQLNPMNAVNDIKNLVSNLTAQGYKVTVDELNLDNEVQLIVKFIKG